MNTLGSRVFYTCFNWGIGVQTLGLSGTYTLVVGNPGNPNTGTYRFTIWSVPTPDRFAISIGDTVTNGLVLTNGVVVTNAPGAGNIETPGALDHYSTTVTPEHDMYFSH